MTCHKSNKMARDSYLGIGKIRKSYSDYGLKRGIRVVY